eukprot:gene14805-19891_t
MFMSEERQILQEENQCIRASVNALEHAYVHPKKTLKVYKTIIQNGGWDNWDMIELEKYPCLDANEAHGRERYYIEQLNANLNTHSLKTKKLRDPIDVYGRYGESGNTYEQFKSRSEIDCIDINKLNIQQSALFIPFTDIFFTTKYGIIGVDNDNKPFLNIKNKLPKKEDMKESNFSSDRINNISKLYFVELQPERRDIKFDLNNNEIYNN